MLVLSRKRDESVIIGKDIVITIVDIRGDKVRLGIEAPGEIPVHRKEVYEAIQREEREENKKSDYHKFREILDSNNFEGAFDIFYETRGEFGNRDEVNKMYYGLIGKW